MEPVCRTSKFQVRVVLRPRWLSQSWFAASYVHLHVLLRAFSAKALPIPRVHLVAQPVVLNAPFCLFVLFVCDALALLVRASGGQAPHELDRVRAELPAIQAEHGQQPQRLEVRDGHAYAFVIKGVVPVLLVLSSGQGLG